jgi:aminobenzoyl-glutamate transport protein
MNTPSAPPPAHPSGAARARSPVVLRILNAVERLGNRLPDPVTLFALFAVAVVLVSWAAAAAGVSAIHPGTGAGIQAVNLLSAEGLRRMLTQAVPNFAAFPPLGLVIVVIIGIAVTERSGLVTVALTRLVRSVPASLLTAAVVFAGVMSSLAVDAGYVVLTPLGAMVFASVGRHPIAGLAAAFAGVSGGFSANLVLTSLDPLLAGLSQEAARLVDPTYVVHATANYYFMAASVGLLVALGTWVTTRYVEPRLGAWQPAGEAPDIMAGDITVRERRGLAAAGLVTVVFLALVALLVIPDGAPLRNPDAAGQPWLVQVRPLLDSLVILLMLLFLAAGLAYGVVAGTIRSDRDAARMSAEGVAVIGSYIVLAFFAAQFIAYFNWSNLGIILAIRGAGGLQAAGFEGLPLLISFVLVATGLNLLIGSASAKWAVMAPIFVPMFMLLGYSPEAVQAAYRVGDSSTNMITPLMPYFPVIIAFAQKYDSKSGLGTLISAMLPYSIVFLSGWLLLFAVWFSFEIPFGPGVTQFYRMP